MLSQPPEVSFGHFAFDPRARLLKRGGVEVRLPPRVLGVLELLLARPGDIVPRQELMETVWKDAFVTDTSLAEAISVLRQALGDDPQAPTYIQTVHRRGYRFLPNIAENPQPAIRVSYDVVAWSIAALSLIGAVSAMWYATRESPVVPPVVQLEVEVGAGLTFHGAAPALALSQTAEAIAWSACETNRCLLFTRAIGSVKSRALDGTDGASAPFFSPDGRWAGFFADGKLKKVLLQGGPPIVIADAAHAGGAVWMRDGHIVFAPSVAGGLLRVRDSGGPIEKLTEPSVVEGELRHILPATTVSGDLTFIAVTSAVSDSGRLMLLPYGTAEWRDAARVLVDNVTAGALVGNEFVAYVRGEDLFAQPYHAIKQEVGGGEQVVASGVVAPHLMVAANGAVAFATSPRSQNGPPPWWRWSGRGGFRVPSLPLLHATLSPASTRIAGIAPDSATQLWTTDLTRGTTTRLTYSPAAASPAWSADGASVFYASRRPKGYEIWMRDASANGEERKALAVDGRHLFPSSAASGRVAYVETGGTGGADVGMLDLLVGTGRLVASTRFDEIAPALSPNGDRVAYQTDESGRWEIVVLDLPSGRRSPVSTTGGTRPVWSADGRSLYFESRGAVMRAEMAADGEPEPVSTVVQLFDSERLVGVALDGQLLLAREAHVPASSMVVTLEWIRELRRVVGPPPVALPR